MNQVTLRFILITNFSAAGINSSIADSFGHTAVNYAKENGHFEESFYFEYFSLLGNILC